MCPSVPLCTRPLMDEDGSALTHHTRWHNVRDLISEHKRCHEELKNGREMRKRARGSEEEHHDGAGGEDVEALKHAAQEAVVESI